MRCGWTAAILTRRHIAAAIGKNKITSLPDGASAKTLTRGSDTLATGKWWAWLLLEAVLARAPDRCLAPSASGAGQHVDLPNHRGARRRHALHAFLRPSGGLHGLTLVNEAQ